MNRNTYFLISFFLLLGGIVHAQKISFSNQNNSGLFWEAQSKNTLNFKISIDEVAFKRVNTENGYYVKPYINDHGNSQIVGYPDLPVFRKLVEIPLKAEIEIVINHYEEKEFSLSDLGIRHQIIPTQSPVSKSSNISEIPFEKNIIAYNTDAYLNNPVVTFDTLGIMRSARIGRLNFSPISYNPTTQKIKVIYNIDFDIRFINADFEATKYLKECTFSPYFKDAYADIINYYEPVLKSNVTQYPVKYVIVSDPMFQAALQPFIQWKTKKGFTVVEAYTNNPNVGNTTTSIKSYLQSLYNLATPSNPAFSFVLFVGDVAQIPSFSGTTGTHVTDLYFCEFTGDMFPEAYYGRFSANNLTELQPQIDKTLEYEQYLMTSTSFLSKSLLVSGTDANFAAVHGNGHINYGTDVYFNSSNNISPLVYLYPASSSAAAQIIQDFSSGVGIVNYTAHCSPSGWAGPYFTTTDVPNLTNAGKYPLMIGNCCSSAEFDVYNSFAEAVLRAPEKGAVGYIGGSNSTYWDEDYWWGVGYKNIILNPSYSSSNLGAFDRLFHSHGEPFNEWFTTQGQIVVAGNLAVTQSGASLTNYYWEIYHLMGDPSLSPYLFEPPSLNITYPNTIVAGVSSILITTEPYTYIGLSRNGVLHGAGLSDATGQLTLNFTPFLTPGTADFVATKQNRQPHINTVNVIIPNGPYVVFKQLSINDSTGNANGLSDYSEHIFLDLTLENVGNQNALNVEAKITSADVNIIVNDSIKTFGNIGSGLTATEISAFSFTVNDFIQDQHNVLFDLIVRDVNDSVWHSNFSVTLNAPKFSLASYTINDTIGNSNGLLDIGETVDFIVHFSNIGGANAYITETSLIALTNDITINVDYDSIGTVNAAETKSSVFNITASASVAAGTPAKLLYSIVNGPYSKSDTITLYIGQIPEFFMKDSIVNTCMMYFYDSGGPNANYGDGENYTVTFTPALPNSYIRATFSSFSVEENTWSGGCWDELHVYDGLNTNAPLIGTYCGNAVPGPFNATNSDGALTFKFLSDFSMNQQGWEAIIECMPINNIDEMMTKEMQIELYPNPSQGIFNIDIYKHTNEHLQLSVIDVHGKVVYNDISNSEKPNKVVDLRHLAKGMYFLRLYNEQNSITKKILIY